MSRAERNNWQKTEVANTTNYTRITAEALIADIIMTSIGSTLTKCPSKNAGLLPSELFKDPPIVTYKGYTSSSKLS